MPRKRPDLKKRLNELRDEPAPPVGITLELDAELYAALKTLARKHRQKIDVYLLRILQQHAAGAEQ